MKVIPSQIFENNSRAEARVHSFLQIINLSNYDVALHSLNIGKHIYKNWSEGDFVIISELGILLIEVKGGRVSCNNGVWEFKNRYNQITKKLEGPGTQAKTAFFSLKNNFLDKKFGWLLKDIPCGFACVFTDIKRVVTVKESELNELPDEITAYEPLCRSPEAFKNWIKSVFAVYRKRVKNQKNLRKLSKDEIEQIQLFLRPNFDVQPALGFQIRDFDEMLLSLTEDQYKVIAGIESNDRVIIEGGAGTGKTFCAMASARNHAGNGEDVLIITRSPFLAAFLKSTEKIPVNIHILSWEELITTDIKTKFDVLVVDEGQDLCQFDVLETLEKLIKGGIEKGKWRWFCDKDHQISPSFKFEKDAFEYLSSLNAFRYSFQSNVRNTPAIIFNIETFSRVKMEKNAKGFGGNVYFEKAEERHLKLDILVEYLEKWKKDEDVKLYDICILCNDLIMVEELTNDLSKRNYRVENLNINTMKKERKSIMVSTVEDFKGLERSIVCIFDLPDKEGSEYLKKFFYKAFSRALHTILVISELEKVEIVNRVLETE